MGDRVAREVAAGRTEAEHPTRNFRERACRHDNEAADYPDRGSNLAHLVIVKAANTGRGVCDSTVSEARRGSAWPEQFTTPMAMRLDREEPRAGDDGVT